MSFQGPHLRTLVLDNEAVQAGLHEHHRKHRALLAILTTVNQRRRRNQAVLVQVTTAVRVEAGWDRSALLATNLNRLLAAADVELSSTRANRCVELRKQSKFKVSLVDATVAQAAQAAQQPAAVLTSDQQDMLSLSEVCMPSFGVVRL